MNKSTEYNDKINTYNRGSTACINIFCAYICIILPHIITRLLHIVICMVIRQYRRSIASWQSSTPSTPVEKIVVNWRVQVFANSTVNLHFHRKKMAIFQCTWCKNGIAFVMNTFSPNNDDCKVKKL